MGLPDPELSVVLCDNTYIHQLNLQWRGEDTPTDVLSFPLHEFSAPGEFLGVGPAAHGAAAGEIALGDIVISLEYAQGLIDTGEHRQRVAHELGVPPESLEWSLAHEVHFLLIHGLLHLIGHDHLEPEEERRMKSEERRLWEAAQPYG